MFSHLRLRKTPNLSPWWTFFLISAFALLLTPSLNAQQPQFDALAARVAEELTKTNEKTVIVLDFMGPDKSFTALGQKIADDFNDTLSKTGLGLTVVNRSEILTTLENYRFSHQVFQDPEMEVWFARKLGAKLMVSGELRLDGENLDVSVNNYRTNGQAIIGFKIKLPMNEQMKLLMDISADPDEHEPAAFPLAQKTGYSSPACLACPSASFSPKAIKNHTQGTVVLEVVVGTDGKTRDIRVLKGLPNGLTDSAIEAVQSWKFKPATGPDKSPAAVRQIIEVVFHRVD
jgi:TonB family protein